MGFASVSLLALVMAPPAPPSPVATAEKQAAAAVALLPGHPAEALAAARKALAPTAEFEPTAFVTAGRKGEVVEDAYLAARESYRAHRAKLYEAVGLALAGSGDGTAALRYLRRAVELDPRPERTTGLCRTLLAQGRGREAMLVLEGAIGPEALGPDTTALLERAVDLVGLQSAQGEIDRVRLRAVAGAEYRDGPLVFPDGLRLSTSPIFRPEDAPLNVYYVAEGSCRSCSSDLADLKRLVPPPARILLVPESLEQDRALRQVVDIYRYGWPLLVGKSMREVLGVEPRSLLVTARGGWVMVALKPPWVASLPVALGIVARNDVAETLPRAQWNHVKPIRSTAGGILPGLLPEGLAPGDDTVAPPDFVAAVEAYRAGRFAEALRLFDAVEAKGDGFLLPPEARLNRALCLAGLGRREEARKMLLKTGDSRLQEDVDRALEKVASPPR
jgi:tetratricopeptide (TPR) repeat protein